MLAYIDRHWIEHPEHVIRSWLHKKKRNLLCVLDGWHSKHKVKTTAATKNQKSLLEFAGFTVSRPPDQAQDVRCLPNHGQATQALLREYHSAGPSWVRPQALM